MPMGSGFKGIRKLDRLYPQPMDATLPYVNNRCCFAFPDILHQCELIVIPWGYNVRSTVVDELI